MNDTEPVDHGPDWPSAATSPGEADSASPGEGPAISRRNFLAGTAAVTAALALPLNRQIRSAVHLAPAKNAADDMLTIAFYTTAAGVKPMSGLLAVFKKLTGITVNPIAVPANSWVGFMQAVSTRIAGGQVLDSAQLATEAFLLFEKRGLCAPLDSYVAQDKATVDNFYADIDPHVLANFQALDNVGGTYIMPYGYNVMSMWVNVAMFRKYGVALPNSDWTWDEFLAAATKMASAPNRYGYGIVAPVPGPFTDVYPWVLTAGGQIMNARQSACVADNPGAIEAATFVRSLVTKGLANEPGGSYNFETESAGLKLAMFGGGVWPLLSIPLPPAQVTKEFVILPWPKQTSPGTPVGVGGFPILKASNAKPAVWEFIKWFMNPEFQGPFAADFGGAMPIRRSSASDPALLKKYPPGAINFVSELAHSTPIVGVPNAGAVENEISTVWEQILSGATSPAAGLKTRTAATR